VVKWQELGGDALLRRHVAVVANACMHAFPGCHGNHGCRQSGHGADFCVQARSGFLHMLGRATDPPEKTVEQCGELIRTFLNLPEHAVTLLDTEAGRSCLQSSVKHRGKSMVIALLDEGNSSKEQVVQLVRHRDLKGRTVLHTCAKHGHVDTARKVRALHAATSHSSRQARQ
jgi:hypothetical protein